MSEKNHECKMKKCSQEKNEEVKCGEDWRGKNYAFFSNVECECFPCHETKHPEDFNCLFCYCPLYALGDNCGGNPKYLENGIKDCSCCDRPHKRESYGFIIERFGDISELTRKK